MKNFGRVWWWGLMVLVVGTLYGCGFLDMAMGMQDDGQGGVTSSPTAPINAIWGFVEMLGPWGLGAAALGRWGTVEYRHRRLIAAGKRDDNKDGIDDETQKLPPFTGGTGGAGGSGASGPLT